jgi:hypothetical protein
MIGAIIGLSVTAYTLIWLCVATPVIARMLTYSDKPDDEEVVMAMVICLAWPLVAIFLTLFGIADHMTMRPIEKAEAKRNAEIESARKVRDLEIELGIRKPEPDIYTRYGIQGRLS